MTSSKRTDSQTTAVSAAEAAVCRDEYEKAELGKDEIIEALKLRLAQAEEPAECNKQSAHRIARATDGDERDPARDQSVATRRAACVRDDRGECEEAVPGHNRVSKYVRRRGIPPGSRRRL